MYLVITDKNVTGAAPVELSETLLENCVYRVSNGRANVVVMKPFVDGGVMLDDLLGDAIKKSPNLEVKLMSGGVSVKTLPGVLYQYTLSEREGVLTEQAEFAVGQEYAPYLASQVVLSSGGYNANNGTVVGQEGSLIINANDFFHNKSLVSTAHSAAPATTIVAGDFDLTKFTVAGVSLATEAAVHVLANNKIGIYVTGATKASIDAAFGTDQTLAVQAGFNGAESVAQSIVLTASTEIL